METIYVVKEDNHGEIGYARTLKGVAEILVNGGWVTPKSEMWNGEKDIPLVPNYLQEVTVESVEKALTEDKDFFTDWIYVTLEELHQ